MFVDQLGNCLPQGTVLRVPSLFDHEGIVAYDWTGQQVMIHNSKRRGAPAITPPEEFNDSVHPVVIVRCPMNPQQGALVVQSASQDAQVPRRWTVFDNCQDFVSRAYGAKSGSATRNVAVGLLLAAGLVASIAG